MFTLLQFFNAGNSYAQTNPTNFGWVDFVFLCQDNPSDPYFEITFPAGTLVNPDYHFHSGLDFDPTQGPNWFTSGTDLFAFPNFFTDYRDFGYVDFIGEDNFGREINARVYFIDCCIEVPPSVAGILAEPLPISFWNATGFFSGQNILVLGDVEVDVNMESVGCNYKMSTDASFMLNADIEFEADNTDFNPYCNYFWDRIHAPFENNKISITNNSTWNGTIRGVHGENSAQITLEESQAHNNFISILLENYDDNGPFNGSYIKVDGCNFEINFHIMQVSEIHPLSPINLPSILLYMPASNPEACAIRLINTEFAEIGNQNYSANSFNYNNITDNFCYICISENSNVVVENNDFLNDAWHSFLALESAVRLGGPNVNQGNYFYGTQLIFEEGSTNIQNCYFDGLPLASVPLRKISLNESVPLTPPGGVEGNHILNNYLYNFELEAINSTPSTNLDVDVKFNITEGSSFTFENIHGSAPTRLTVNNNTMLNAHRDFLVKLTECNNATVGLNIFRNSQTNYDISSAQGTQAVGVYIDNSQNVSLHNNTFIPLVAAPNPQIGFKSGVYATNNIQDVQFYCNEFYNVYNGIQFYDGVITTSIGFPNTSPGSGANNTFELLPGFPGTGSLWSSPFSSILVHFFLMTNQIDYFWDGTAGSMYDPDPYGAGIVFLRGAVFGDDDGGVGCPSIPQKRFEPIENNFETIVNHSILAYPNPSKEQMIIEIPEDYLQSTYFITDAQGKVIRRDNVMSEQLRLSLPQGQYILMIDTPSSSPIRKKLVFLN